MATTNSVHQEPHFSPIDRKEAFGHLFRSIYKNHGMLVFDVSGLQNFPNAQIESYMETQEDGNLKEADSATLIDQWLFPLASLVCTSVGHHKIGQRKANSVE